jgi:hypothetical protein
MFADQLIEAPNPGVPNDNFPGYCFAKSANSRSVCTGSVGLTVIANET